MARGARGARRRARVSRSPRDWRAARPRRKKQKQAPEKSAAVRKKELMQNKVAQLRKMCDEAGLDDKGRKADMVKRLLQHECDNS